MNSRERVLASLERTGYDRIPIKHDGTPEVNKILMQHFGLSNMEQLLRVVGDDFRCVAPVYCGPELRTFPDGSVEGYFGERYIHFQYGEGKYLEASHLPFAGVDSLDKLDQSHFPTAEWFDYSTVKQQCEAVREFAVCGGGPGEMDFINGISRARGMEQVMIDLITRDPVYLTILDARFEFYYQTQERTLQAADGLIDTMHIGEDLGNQLGPMISMDIFDEIFAPRLEKYFAMVHGYGAKTMMHMCGCVEAFLPRLIALGLDIYDVVQPTTPEMDIAYLAEHHGDRLDFCGSMCVQTTLPHGTVQDVEREVQRRLALFPDGGLILGPTHAIQLGTPLENTLALYRAAGSLREEIDDSILSIKADADAVDKIDMAKLY